MPLTRSRAARLALALGCCAAGLTACHGSTAAKGGTDSARSALDRSVAPLGTTSYAVTLNTSTMHAVGVIDPTAHAATLTATPADADTPAQVSILAIEDDSWAKIDPGTGGSAIHVNPDKWLKLDPAKLTPTSLPFDVDHLTDAFDLQALLTRVLSVKQTDASHLTGTIDLAGVTGVDAAIPSGQSLGTAAANLPFTATLDAQGRLTEFEVGSTGSATGFDLGISDYAAAVTPNRPDDNQVTTAPAAVYPLLRMG